MSKDIAMNYVLSGGHYLEGADSSLTRTKLIGLNPAGNPSCERALYNQKIEYNRLPVPVVSTKASGGGVATGTAGDVNLLSWPGVTHEHFIIGTQTIVVPTMAAGGFDIGTQDQTSGDGCEINDGLLGNGDNVFVTGTAPAFYVEYELKGGTVASLGTLMCGFRKVAANAALYTSYTDYAGFLLTAGAINIKTRKASGTAVTTDSTQTMTDATLQRFKVLVSSSGVLSYQINGNAPTVVPTSAVTWTAGTSVMPFIEFIQGASQTTLLIKSRSCGYQL